MHTRRFSRLLRLAAAIVLASSFALGASGCLAVSAAKTAVGVGVGAGKAATTVVGKGVSTAADAVVPDRKEPEKDSK